MDILKASHKTVRTQKDSVQVVGNEVIYPVQILPDLKPNDKVTFFGYDDDRPFLLSKFKNGKLQVVKEPEVPLFGVPLRNLEGEPNIEQIYFVDDFLDPDIYLHVLTGDAGTGKNFIATLMGLYVSIKTGGETKLIYTRDPIEMGRRQGFLPGNLYEKTNPYMRPIYDTILSLNGYKLTYTVDKLIRDGYLEITPVQTLRGANLRAIGIFDECQNEDVTTLQGYISRFQTPGSKVILLGSFKQIDLQDNRSRLQNSGLYHVLHAFRGWHRYSHVHLVDNMRGELAREVDVRLPYQF